MNCRSGAEENSPVEDGWLGLSIAVNSPHAGEQVVGFAVASLSYSNHSNTAVNSSPAGL